MSDWKRRAEQRVGPSTAPVWQDRVPMCTPLCHYNDGKRCNIIGHRAPGVCTPVVDAMGAMLGAASPEAETHPTSFNCEHANEVTTGPCPCPSTCYCRGKTCRPPGVEVAIDFRDRVGHPAWGSFARMGLSDPFVHATWRAFRDGWDACERSKETP